MFERVAAGDLDEVNSQINQLNKAGFKCIPSTLKAKMGYGGSFHFSVLMRIEDPNTKTDSTAIEEIKDKVGVN